MHLILNTLKHWVPYTQESFVQSLVEICLTVLENDFPKIDDVFFIFYYNFPSDEALAFHLTNMNIFSPNDVLLQICHNINLILSKAVKWKTALPYKGSGHHHDSSQPQSGVYKQQRLQVFPKSEDNKIKHHKVYQRSMCCLLTQFSFLRQVLSSLCILSI